MRTNCNESLTGLVQLEGITLKTGSPYSTSDFSPIPAINRTNVS